VFAEHDKDIEWFRPDPRRRLMPAWIGGSCLLGLGLVSTTYGFSQLGRDEHLGLLGLVVGLSCVACGMLTFTVSALRALADDTCLGLRIDGLLYRRGGEVARVIPWDALGEVTAERDGLRVRVRVDGDEGLLIRTPFADIEHGEIARRIATTRRRALMGLPLRPAG